VPNQITTTVVVGPGTFAPSTLTAGVAGIDPRGILSVGHDTALGNARLQLGNARIIAAGADRNLSNNLVLNNNVTVVFGGQRDFGGTFDLNLTGGVTLHSSVNTAQVVNLDVLDNQTLVTMSGVISGGGDFIVPTKRGIGTSSGQATTPSTSGTPRGTGSTWESRMESGFPQGFCAWPIPMPWAQVTVSSRT